MALTEGSSKHTNDRKWDQPCVTSVFFEGETQKGNLLPCDSVEETFDNPAGEPPPLVLVHIDHLNKRRVESGVEEHDFA